MGIPGTPRTDRRREAGAREEPAIAMSVGSVRSGATRSGDAREKQAPSARKIPRLYASGFSAGKSPIPCRCSIEP